MKYLIYGLALCAVVVFAALRGGRYERLVALAFFTGWIASQAAYLSLRAGQLTVAMAAVDLCVLTTLVWLRRRHAAAWLTVQVVLQATVIPVTTAMVLLRREWVSPAVFEPTLMALSYLQLAGLALAVARRDWGPPYAPPPAG